MEQQESAILELYEKFEQERKNSPEFSKLLRTFSQNRQEFEKTLDTKQRNNLQKLIEIMYDLRTQEGKEFFRDGFSMATRLITEALHKEDIN